jgi:hypothetical protein
MDNNRLRRTEVKGAGYTPEGRFAQPGVGRNEHPLAPPTPWPTGAGPGQEPSPPYRCNTEAALTPAPRPQNQKAGVFRGK